jgi:hypothetical protein
MLAEETWFLGHVASKQPTAWRRVDVCVFERLLGLDVRPLPVEVPDRDTLQQSPEYADSFPLDAWYSVLAWSIPERDDAWTERALIAIAESWLGSQDAVLDPESNPGWEWVPAAIATVARRSGYRPRALPARVEQFYRPGLTPSEASQVLPELVVHVQDTT